MIHQRRRFNYLSGHQRNVNALAVSESEKPFKAGCIVSSNLNLHSNKQPIASSQNYSSRLSRNSSIQKYSEPLCEIQSNIPSFNQGKSATKLFSASKKEIFAQQMFQSSYNKQNLSFSSNKQTHKQLQQKITHLQQQNTLILTQTEEKFLQMQKHLEKVQNILREKEQIIEKLTQQNKTLKQQLDEENTLLKQQNQQLQNHNIQLKDEKQELIRIIADKNKTIEYMNNQIQQFQTNQTELLTKINSLIQQHQKLKSQNLILSARPTKEKKQVQVQTQQVQKQLEFGVKLKSAAFSQQTDLNADQIQGLLEKTNQHQTKINYKKKYETLFKQALQMEDQVYQLKQQLFDTQAQSKILQQEFSTYKLLYQIQQISQKTSPKTV